MDSENKHKSNINNNDETVKLNEGLINWIKLHQRDFSYNVGTPLMILNKKKIAIYDMGRLGVLLFNELTMRGWFDIKYLIDDNKSVSVGGVYSKTLSSFDRIDDVDAIIVASETDIEGDLNKLRDKTNAHVYPLSWLLDRKNHYTLTIRPLVQLAYYLRTIGVSFYFVAIASVFGHIQNLSDREKFLKDNYVFGYGELIKNLSPQDLKKYTEPLIFDRYTYEDFMEGICKTVPKVTSSYKNGHLVFDDLTSKYINHVNGNRFTTDNPETYSNKVYFFGDSTAYSAYTQDADTIQSNFQRFVNNNLGDKYCVVNCASPFGKGHSYDRIIDTDFKKGDIVFCVNSFDRQYDLPEVCKEAGIDYLDTNYIFYRPHNFGEIFMDGEHLNHTGNQLVAKAIYNIAINKREQMSKLNPDFDISGIYEDIQKYQDHKDDSIAGSREFKDYIQSLLPLRVNVDGIIGAIVMNCNPFTLGHQYLIEYAAEQVEFLYIFIVEEDRSIFPFKDRLELVKKGTNHLKNVMVLPSGRFIISSLTFPDYFEKGKAKEVVVDTSRDIDLFTDHIAKTLGISVRFVGNEPNCKVTKQYNDYMRTALPKAGIEFVEIQRKEVGGLPISASRVRELLEKRNFEEVANIVPKTTLDYLKEMNI